MNFLKMKRYLEKNPAEKPRTKDKVIMSGTVRNRHIDVPSVSGFSWLCCR